MSRTCRRCSHVFAKGEKGAVIRRGRLRLLFCDTCAAGVTVTMRRQKYGAKRTAFDGYSFASQAEARRYVELCRLQQAGEIRDLVVHPSFVLFGHGVRRLDDANALITRLDRPVGRYTADFRYVRVSDSRIVIEDVKGGKATRTEAYQLRKRLFEATYDTSITEVA